MQQRKVCIIGAFAVGKTSLFDRFVYNRFGALYQTTLGIRVQRKQLASTSGPLTLILWDIEGATADRTLRESYLLGAAGAVLVCDLSRPATIASLPEFAARLRALHPTIAIVIAANKRDLIVPDSPQIDALAKTAAALSVPQILTSASDGSGVGQLFATLGEQVLRDEPGA